MGGGRHAGTGLIPARAGKTRPRPTCRSPRRAHPRACGENVSLVPPATALRGSSPRVRGKHLLSSSMRVRAGLIPARAGKTDSRRSPPGKGSAHPRACGENIRPRSSNISRPGSSPRVRGKPVDDGAVGGFPRLIPARAGKTRGHPVHRLKEAAHPRACGENLPKPPETTADDGSSPRVRGKPDDAVDDAADDRLIPARAGKTHQGHWGGGGVWAHPRACGENPSTDGRSSAGAGSSPRVRGKRDDEDLVNAGTGLIPARAGKTTRTW